ncbi:putative quinol monooxygenase [Nocardia terpenica]|uniref:Antibiotic biosynthesis monooxygenase n=1 Tax=Nocardia terpenica TaxID=455432 RepID=A0A161Z9D3_9NOCA|nr:putative quinol monooxygenase [Nocardia terpenica]KZM75692.1 antibiotic biosynthesis monooxygenase [Nocardia terpenica]NQE86198.1 antibiotic biosynthesis monooxygenase [Nocardia terpenica]
MTYHVFVQFDVPPARRNDFIAHANFDATGSLANEPGTLRFEVLQDEDNPNRFYLGEVYEDEAAFEHHCNQPTIRKFYEFVDSYAQGPNFWARAYRREQKG